MFIVITAVMEYNEEVKRAKGKAGGSYVKGWMNFPSRTDLIKPPPRNTQY